jgi:hypothetical protein
MQFYEQVYFQALVSLPIKCGFLASAQYLFVSGRLADKRRACALLIASRNGAFDLSLVWPAVPSKAVSLLPTTLVC